MLNWLGQLAGEFSQIQPIISYITSRHRRHMLYRECKSASSAQRSVRDPMAMGAGGVGLESIEVEKINAEPNLRWRVHNEV